MGNYLIKSIDKGIYGEGSRAGSAAVFVKFASCNLWDGRPIDRIKGKGSCAQWCDANFAGGEKYSGGELLLRINALSPPDDCERWCVLTGGEPALQIDLELIKQLREYGWKILLETNGTVDSDAVRSVDWLVVSPKRGGDVTVRGGDELHMMLSDGEDWLAQELLDFGHARLWQYRYVLPIDPLNGTEVEDTHLHSKGTIKITGVKEAYDKAVKRCIKFVEENPAWRLSLQIQKFLP